MTGYKSTFAILAACALLLGACSAALDESAIATAVAMTVRAQDTEEAARASATPLSTDPPPFVSPTAAGATKAPPTAPPTGVGGGPSTCIGASLVGETVPDGTIMNPGQVFTKTWRIKNTGTCPWDSSWKLVFTQGDLMGGAYIYDFPQPATPGQTVDVPVVLTAPATDGTYKGYWKIQSPWGGIFGVGEYDSAFWVQVVVGTSSGGTGLAYGVTSVTYDIARDPTGGCPTNVFYTVTAYVTVNGPITIKYTWKQSDGNSDDAKGTLIFTEAGSKAVSRTWSLHLGAATNTRWMQFVVTAPTYTEYSKANFDYTCH
jgi:hypothetical protein